jgi:hypothetical protein
MGANLPQPGVIFQAIKVQQPDGTVMIKPGRPIILEEEISTHEAARIMGLSQRHIETQCAEGEFRTAYKPGGRPRSKWRITRAEVLARKSPPME